MRARFLLAVGMLALLPFAANAIDTFPGAVGYGKIVSGGRGGTLCFVTNLNDAGAGSLRDCLATQSGARTIIFRVGGNIQLASQLATFNGSVTIAGQTAPGGGISIETPDVTSWAGAVVMFKGGAGGNVYMSNIRIRPGRPTDPTNASTNRHDGILFDNIGAAGVYMRNVSIQGGSDENVDLYRNVSNVTFHNIITAYGVLNHGKGMLLCDDSTTCGSITIYQSLFASNLDRNPDLHMAPAATNVVDMINNVIYNPADGTEMWSIQGGSWANFFGNSYVAGPDTNASTAAIRTWDTGAQAPMDTRFYAPSTCQYSNFADFPLCDGAGQTFADCIVQTNGFGTRVTEPLATISAPMRVTGANAWQFIRNRVGVVRPGRDALDAAIVACVDAKSGCPHITQIPSRPALANGTPYTDTDTDGMADSWETLHGMNVGAADNNGDVNGDGYTNLEEFLAYLNG